MPIYTYKCTGCDSQFERTLRLTDHAQPQPCPECDAGPAQQVVTSGVGFVLRGDGWAGKNIRVKGQMSSRRKHLGAKESAYKKEAPGMTLTPNVDGEQVDSWAEARKFAQSKGKDASSFDAMVRKERKEGKRA